MDSAKENEDNEENRVTIVLIHLGLEHELTIKLLNKIPTKFLSVITKIELRDDLKDWLECNSKGVKIETFPSFLITINGDTTVYTDKQYKEIIKLISDLL